MTWILLNEDDVWAGDSVGPFPTERDTHHAIQILAVRLPGMGFFPCEVKGMDRYVNDHPEGWGDVGSDDDDIEPTPIRRF